MIITRSSSFIDTIWLMAYNLNCEHIWFDNLLTLEIRDEDEDYKKNNKNKTYNNNNNSEGKE